MIAVTVHRPDPPDGPWLLYDDAGEFIELVEDRDGWLAAHVDTPSARLIADRGPNGWTFLGQVSTY